MMETQKRIFGQRNRCPICSEMPPEGQDLIGGTACRYCHAPLWYVSLFWPKVWYYSIRKPSERIGDFIADLFADLDARERQTLTEFITKNQFSPNADWLDTVEFAVKVIELLRARVT